jgi:hypothetical protein
LGYIATTLATLHSNLVFHGIIGFLVQSLKLNPGFFVPTGFTASALNLKISPGKPDAKNFKNSFYNIQIHKIENQQAYNAGASCIGIVFFVLI